MNWTPKGTPPTKPGYPICWVKNNEDGREWMGFSYFLNLVGPQDQWSIERTHNVTVLYWMEITPPAEEDHYLPIPAKKVAK